MVLRHLARVPLTDTGTCDPCSLWFLLHRRRSKRLCSHTDSAGDVMMVSVRGTRARCRGGRRSWKHQGEQNDGFLPLFVVVKMGREQSCGFMPLFVPPEADS